MSNRIQPEQSVKKPNRPPRSNKCSLCQTDLQHKSFSDHYCQEDIHITCNGIIKSLLKKNNPLRQGFPEVQHVWADKNPENPKEYLLKIKAPTNIIPQFLKELQSEISQNRPNRPNQPNRPKINKDKKVKFQYSSQICSFYNSPDGCTNENCNREHIDNAEEKERLLKLKDIIDSSKVLNEPIKAYYTLLDDCELETRELNESIQRNFENQLHQPSTIQPSIEKIQKVYQLGFELEELRTQLKFISRRCYTDSDPSLIYGLQETIKQTQTKVKTIEELQNTPDEMYNLTHYIYSQQFLHTCSLVV
jgi:hypothetical protein